jgi:hypothetical protein
LVLLLEVEGNHSNEVHISLTVTVFVDPLFGGASRSPVMTNADASSLFGADIEQTDARKI